MTWTRAFSDASWDRLLAGHPEATFFHTRIWTAIVREAFPDVADECLALDAPHETTN